MGRSPPAPSIPGILHLYLCAKLHLNSMETLVAGEMAPKEEHSGVWINKGNARTSGPEITAKRWSCSLVQMWINWMSLMQYKIDHAFWGHWNLRSPGSNWSGILGPLRIGSHNHTHRRLMYPPSPGREYIHRVGFWSGVRKVLMDSVGLEGNIIIILLLRQHEPLTREI